MILKITTPWYKLDEVTSLVQFAARQVGVTHARLRVTVKDYAQAPKYWRGWAYNYGLTGEATRTITLKIGCNPTLPILACKRPVFQLDTWQEILVFLAAHEFRHIADFDAGHKTHEADCNFEGRYAVLQYRKGSWAN